MTGIAAGRKRLNELAHRYLTEGATPLRQAAAIGLGLFIGCLPIYGLHLPLCLLVGSGLGLNRLKLYLTANISNPLLAPLLVLASIQIAGRIQNGAFYPISLGTLRTVNPWDFGVQLLWGSALLGLTLGVIGFLGTYGLKLRSTLTPAEANFREQAAKPYVPFGIVSWWRAHARLRRDARYREIAEGRVVPLEGTLLDVGCGSGILLSALRVGRVLGATPFDLVGIENDPRDASIARVALEGDATIIEDDPRTAPLPQCHVLFLLDVLHRLGNEEQREHLIEKASASIENGGAIVIGERKEEGRRFRPLLEKLGFEVDFVQTSPGRELVRAVKRGARRPV